MSEMLLNPGETREEKRERESQIKVDVRWQAMPANRERPSTGLRRCEAKMRFGGGLVGADEMRYYGVVKERPKTTRSV